MMKVWQTADGGLPENTNGDIVSEMNNPSIHFIVNQISAMCLPLVTEAQRLIWVYSNQIDLQHSEAAELSKAFDRFPYLTQQQTATLAKRCSLHPDQVRVWFMEQRLRYGISWDYEDIIAIESKLSTNQEEVGDMKKTVKSKVKNSGWKTARRGKRASEGQMIGKDVEACEKLDKGGWIKAELTVQKGKERNKEEDKKKAQNKRKRTTEKRAKEQDGDGCVVEREKEGPKNVQMDETICTRKKKEVKGDKRVRSGLQWTEGFKLPPRNRPYAITFAQRAQLKESFLHCQYPNDDDYNKLSQLCGVPRYILVKWFGDMRYYVKKRVRPGWMSKEQHGRAQANIRYRQYLRAMVRSQLSQKSNETARKMKVGMGEESVQGPLEAI